MKQIRLAKPYFSAEDARKIGRDINSVLENGWLTTGRFASELEQKFCDAVQTSFAVSLNSGTAALHTMMAWAQLQRGDEVIVPANTFASTANAVLYEGGTPVLADCDELTFNISAEEIESKISPKTKAVIVTHIAGNPCEMEKITRVCSDRQVSLFEDAAHAIGSRYKDRPCGSFGLGAAFSLYPTKVVTSAEGGVLTTNNEDLASFAKLYRNVGRRSLGSGPIEILGRNYRLSDVHAIIGLSQIKHLQRFVRERNRLAKLYSRMLANECGPWIRPQAVADHSRSSYYAYIVKLDDAAPISRDALMAKMKSGYHIETTVMFHPLQSQPYLKKYNLPSSCPVSDDIGNNSVALPLYVGMTNEDVSKIVSAIARLVPN